MGGGLEVDIALAALATATKHEGLIGLGQIRKGLKALHCLASLRVLHRGDPRDQGANRHLEDDVLCTASSALVGSTLVTVLGQQFGIEEILPQRVGAGVCLKDDAAALASVATVWAALGTEFAAVKVHGTVAALSGSCKNLDLINKHEVSMCSRGWSHAQGRSRPERPGVAHGTPCLRLRQNRALHRNLRRWLLPFCSSLL